MKSLRTGKKILVALGGGMGSSVAAALLKSQGYDVHALYLKIWMGQRSEETCCSVGDPSVARAFCDRLDLPFHTLDVEGPFSDKVVDYHVHEYLQQRRPATCVACTHEVKFPALLRKADELGFEMIATGHYAQVIRDGADGFFKVCKAIDPAQDQSYFLYRLHQDVLRRLVMPLGGLANPVVRKVAAEFGVMTKERSGPGALCFEGSEATETFIDVRTPSSLKQPGIVRTVEGRVVGEHSGLHHYAIGQRKQFDVAFAGSDELYVVDFDPAQRALIVGPDVQLLQSRLLATHVSWIRPVNGIHTLRCSAKITPVHDEVPCRVTFFENQMAYVHFDVMQKPVTPGQAIVFYDGDEVLGGALIDRTNVSWI